MHRIACLALLLVSGASLAACSGSWSPPYRATTTMVETRPHEPRSGLEIHSRNGGVRVVAVPDRIDVLVEARITCGGSTQQQADDRLAGTTLVVSRGAGGALVIRPEFPDGPRGADGAAITVQVPDAGEIDIASSNGAVAVLGAGDALAGDVAVDTSNGAVEIRAVRGAADVQTSNGGVTAHDVGGAVVVATSNGPLDLEQIGGAVRVGSSNGGVAIRLGPGHPGPITANTSNGPIDVEVGAAFRGRVALETSNARITVADDAALVRETSLGRSDGFVVVGDGGRASRLKTSNAGIAFRLRGE